MLAKPDGRHSSHQEHSYLARSRYEQQLNSFQKFFSPEQLLIRRSEDLFVQPEKIWSEVLSFLSVSWIPLPESGRHAYQGGGVIEQLPSKQQQRVREMLRESLRPTYVFMSARYGLDWL